MVFCVRRANGASRLVLRFPILLFTSRVGQPGRLTPLQGKEAEGRIFNRANFTRALCVNHWVNDLARWLNYPFFSPSLLSFAFGKENIALFYTLAASPVTGPLGFPTNRFFSFSPSGNPQFPPSRRRR